MITGLNRKEIFYLFLFLSFYLYSCTRPEDHALNKKELNQPLTLSVPEKRGPKLYTVEISGMKFHPDDLLVRSGDTIVWVNKDMTAHCVTEEITKAWTSSKIPADSSWKMIVNVSASYYCAIHQVMKGKITVE
jgi:plastocyanin